jgi:hypothetical protein
MAWQGKRFKTPAYKEYEKAMLLMMPKAKVIHRRDAQGGILFRL